MYPLSDEINNKKSTEESVIEKTDVGGPTLLHAAVKGRRIVLARPEQRIEVIEWLRQGKPDENKFRAKLAAIAEYEVADYMVTSANYLGGQNVAGLMSERVAAPNYGENPWQSGAGLYLSKHIDDPLGIGNFELKDGIPLSYNNYTDVDRLLQTATHIAAGLERNFKNVTKIALGAKHGNLCGAGVDDNPKNAIEKMLDGDQRAIFGGSILINFPITKEVAFAIMTYKISKGKRILDIIIAPAVEDDALDLLKRKNGKLRLLINPRLEELDEKSIDKTQRIRHIRGGRLKQNNYTFIYDYNHPDISWSGKKVNDRQAKDMIIAWAIGSTSNSNTICIVKNGQLLSNGVGQQDRVTSAELALMRAKNAGHKLTGSCAYSDSFFPFPDGPKMLADAGVAAIITTRGSIRDDEVAKELTSAGVSLCTLPDSLARGFFGH
jgi:phosphoribosylaminoimidazolecarboxamide formyltransferase/IMP cyclohydrolase